MDIGITKDQAIKNSISLLTEIKGVGEKSAKAMITHLLSMGSTKITEYIKSFEDLSFFTGQCPQCHNFSQAGQLCEICSNTHRDFSTLCFVKTYEDIEAFEKTGTYNGVYHVLNGLLDPCEENANLHNLTYDTFVNRFKTNLELKTIILGFDGDLESSYTKSWLKLNIKGLAETFKRDIKIFTLSYGLPPDMEISKADEITLKTALDNIKEIV